MGWLNAVPTPEKKKVAGNDERSRLQRFREDGATIPLPDVDAPWLVTWLLEAGPVIAGPMGAMPLGWQDIAAWSQLSGIEPSTWESRQLHSMSREYLAALRDGAKVDCPAPWMSEADIAANRASVSRKLDNMFTAFDLSRRRR